MGNSNNARSITVKSVPWIALLVAFAALGLGLWLMFRKPKGGAVTTVTTSPISSSSSGPEAVSFFDLREVSYFPRGIVNPVRESVNRIMAHIGDMTTKAYTKDKANIDRKLKIAVDKYEKEAMGYTTVNLMLN